LPRLEARAICALSYQEPPRPHSKPSDSRALGVSPICSSVRTIPICHPLPYVSQRAVTTEGIRLLLRDHVSCRCGIGVIPRDVLDCGIARSLCAAPRRIFPFGLRWEPHLYALTIDRALFVEGRNALGAYEARSVVLPADSLTIELGTEGPFTQAATTAAMEAVPGPELKKDRTRKAWPHRLISLKNHATAVFGLGKNFFL
jgi:hypothetical protein